MTTSEHAERAAILAIGTEVVSGQIVNGNAAKISQYLSNAGAQVVLHEAVADDHSDILAALDRCVAAAGLIVVTGGLGPTSDDFTRKVIAEWAHLPLEFYEPSWLKIVERLEKRGINVAPSNRQQCYFPRGAQILPNIEGTADGFFFKIKGAHLWVLPGPPSEIDSIWRGEAELEKMIRSALPPGRIRYRLFTWDCLGKSEAELGEIVEKALKGSGLKTGYRLHRPYVEVKVWVDENAVQDSLPWMTRLETAIAPWLLGRQNEDIAALWITRLKKILGLVEEIEVLDACSAGLLTERIGLPLRKPENHALACALTLATEWAQPSSPESWVESALAQADPGVLTLALAGITAKGEWIVGLRLGERILLEKLKSPHKASAVLDDRVRAYAVETALKKWCDWLISH
jgi:molybdenum cofactor synthesis domain-containing protein